jgi:hypothetical protein
LAAALYVDAIERMFAFYLFLCLFAFADGYSHASATQMDGCKSYALSGPLHQSPPLTSSAWIATEPPGQAPGFALYVDREQNGPARDSFAPVQYEESASLWHVGF